jgi:probable HAF family extracellular repeat protein
MSRRLLALIAAAIPLVLAFAASAQASARYPYTLIDPGTFGGPNSFFDGPGVPIAGNGTLVGAADTTTLDSDYPHCAPPGGCFDPHIQHGFAYSNGRLTDLGALPGQNVSAIYELNSNGIGVGSSESGADDPNTGTAAQVAVMFRHGHVINLGTLPGGSESFAQDINDQGQIAGNSSNATPDPYSIFGWGTETRAFVWRNGVMHDLGTLGGDDAVEYVQNERGQIAGWSYTNDTPNADSHETPTTDPFLWQNGHMTDLGTFGGDVGNTNWMNNRGEVVGFSSLAGDQTIRPFLWNGSRMIDLGTLGGQNGTANWINSNGDVAGWAELRDKPGHLIFHAALWRNGKTLNLPPVDGAPWSFANSVNDQDQVVGNTTDAKGNELTAVLWSHGHAYDLNALIAPSTLHLTSGEYIDDQGDIVANGTFTSGPSKGDRRMVLLLRRRLLRRQLARTATHSLPSGIGTPVPRSR